MVFKNIYMVGSNHLVHQCAGHFSASGVGGVQNAAMAMAAFLSQMIVLLICVTGKVDALLNKPVNSIWAILDY